MNFTMYCDNSKNMFIALPDNMSDEDICSLGELLYMNQDIEDIYASESLKTSSINIKPTGCLNLAGTHASYRVNEIMPDLFSGGWV